MWLMYGDDVVFGGLMCGFQYGGDFDWVVVVIVDDGDVIYFVYVGEVVIDVVEFGQCIVDLCVFYVQMVGDGDSGQCV